MPESLPLDTDAVVLGSGVAEIGLGSALLRAPRSSRRRVGTIAAWFFVAGFPGNVAQWLNRRSAFGLDTDAKRIGRCSATAADRRRPLVDPPAAAGVGLAVRVVTGMGRQRAAPTPVDGGRGRFFIRHHRPEARHPLAGGRRVADVVASVVLLVVLALEAVVAGWAIVLLSLAFGSCNAPGNSCNVALGERWTSAGALGLIALVVIVWAGFRGPASDDVAGPGGGDHAAIVVCSSPAGCSWTRRSRAGSDHFLFLHGLGVVRVSHR